MKKTRLYDEHIRLGGKMVDFGGFLLPVQYKSITEEHHAVRTKAGLFDVSHMGEFFVEGQDALDFLQHILSNDISKLEAGRAMYAVMCNEDGGILDDLLTYMLDVDRYMIVPNAGNIQKDYDWMQEQIKAFPNATLSDRSDQIALFALQGPKAKAYLEKLVDPEILANLRFYRFQDKVNIGGISCLLSRTGYTGEDGFELYHEVEDSNELWTKLMALDLDGEFIVAAGLGARDSLRMEAGLLLYGNEMTEAINPLELSMDRFVKLDKASFIGKAALENIKDTGPKRRLIGLKTTGKGIPRSGYTVLKDEQEIGTLTSGGLAPSLGYPVAMALVDDVELKIGDTVLVAIRNRTIEHEVCEIPFYKRPKA